MMTDEASLPWHDLSLFDHIGLDLADKQRAFIRQCLHFGRGGGSLETFHIVRPEIGDAVDRDLGFSNIGASTDADIWD